MLYFTPSESYSLRPAIREERNDPKLMTPMRSIRSLTISLMIALSVASASSAPPGAPDEGHDTSLITDLTLKTRHLMPESLKTLLRQREHVLIRGVCETVEPIPADRIRPLIDTEMEALRNQLNGTPDFDDVVYRFGRLARLVVAATDWDNFAREPDAPAVFSDFRKYIRQRHSRFVAVFYDYSPLLFRQRQPAAYLEQMLTRCRDYTRRVEEIYRQGGSSRTFDDRSPAFGLAALQYSHTITDIANLWLYCWREANGDMTGVPFYPYPINHHVPKGATHGENSDSSHQRLR